MRHRWDVAGLAAWSLTACIAVSGSASRPSGWTVGLPSGAMLGGLAAATLILGLAAERRTWRLGLATLPATGLALFGLPWTAAAVFTGGPLLALAFGVAAAMLAAGARPWTRRALLPAAVAVALVGSVRAQQQVGPEGDEPHYLMVADSLLVDGDLAVAEDFAAGRYRAFVDRPLEPHYRVRGRDGEIYSLHALGLSLLVLPAYAAKGYAGASLFLAALAVLLVVEVRALARAWLDDDRTADGVAWLVALGAPLAHYAGLVFTEVPAALGLAFALRTATDPRTGPRRALAAGLALAFLPWLNVRYALLSGVVLALALARRPGPSPALAWLAPAAASAVAIAAYHFALYGFFDPRRVYGRRREFALDVLPTGLPGLFLDQEFGLFAYAPALALSAVGLAVLARRRLGAALACLALIVVVVGVAACWPMWRGGFNPPGRFLVPLLPVLAVAAGAAVQRGLTAPAALLIGWTVWTGLLGTLDRPLVHRDRDGVAPLLRVHSGAVEWTRLLPGFVLDDTSSDRARLGLLWAFALSAAVSSRRRATAPRLALSVVGAMGIAWTAEGLTGRTAGGREAVHTLGRPSLAVPGWQPGGDAVWAADTLGWGPAYEPHRHAAGAVIGARLALPGGRYRLTVSGEAPGGSSPALLEVRRAHEPSGWTIPLAEVPGGWGAELGLEDGPTVTLALRGGGAFLVEEIRLGAQPLAAAGSPKE